MNYKDSIVIVLFLLIILGFMAGYMDWSPREKFDTYRNHDYWSADYRGGCGTPECMDQASLKSKYTWSERDPAGMTIYDKYYQDLAEKKAQRSDPEYFLREQETEDNVYDTRFSTMSGNDYSVYKIADMLDRHPVTVEVNGNILNLSQKNY